MAVIRARMCERVAEEAGRQSLSSQAFLTGMFSLLGALLKRPMEEVADDMKFPDPLRNALVERDCSSDLCAILTAVENYEKADWETVQTCATRLQVEPPAVADAYVEAVRWARELQV